VCSSTCIDKYFIFLPRWFHKIHVYTRRMNTTRKMDKPTEDPTTLREFTVRRGKTGWWRVYNNKWEPIKKLKTRKRKMGKAAKMWTETKGAIMVRYNKDTKCDLIESKDKCLVPYLEESEWMYGDSFPPSSEKDKYTNNDEYIGPLNTMDEFKKKLNTHYKKYKSKGYITNYTLDAVPLKDINTLL